MEDGLRRIPSYSCEVKGLRVLILVVMEDGLRQYMDIAEQ